MVVPPWPKSITWWNKIGEIVANDNYRIIEDGHGVYIIEVKQSQDCDNGEWRCEVVNEHGCAGVSKCVVEMEIPKNYRKPRFMEVLKAVLTEEGLVSFECKVIGFPTPNLMWFKDGQELKPGDVYQLTGINSLGTYCCIAKNCMGEASSMAVLTVEDIQNQLNEDEKDVLALINQPPVFTKCLRNQQAKIDDDMSFIVEGMNYHKFQISLH